MSGHRWLRNAGGRISSVQERVARDLSVTVRVYNYAQVPNGTVAQAEREANRIFATVGITIAWFNCAVSLETMGVQAGCPQLLDSPAYTLRIVPRGGARAPFRETVLGWALLHPSGKPGTTATVFQQRICRLTSGADSTESHILSLVMTHEIGHLLLGAQGHAWHGIMRGQWSPEDLRRRSGAGFLLLTQQQGEMMRHNLLQWSFSGFSASGK